MGPLFSTFTLEMPSSVIEMSAGVAPAMTRSPLSSVCTPGLVVRVEMGLVEPFAWAKMATGRLTSCSPVSAVARVDVSVVMTFSALLDTCTV